MAKAVSYWTVLFDNEEKTGYVSGGFIAQDYHISSENYIFLYGLYKFYSDDAIKFQIRVAENNKEIDKIEYFPVEIADDDYGFDVYLNTAINNGIHIIVTTFLRATCGGGQHNQTTFFFENNKIYEVRSFSNSDSKSLGYSNGKVQLYEWKWRGDDIDEFEGREEYKELVEEYIWSEGELKTIAKIKQVRY